MKRIPVRGATSAFVDDAHYDHLRRFRWGITKNGYVIGHRRLSSGRYETVYMHSEVLWVHGLEAKMVDHRNRNRLDNQYHNLRECTRRSNNANSGPHIDNTSGFKGVSFKKSHNKWVAKLRVQGKQLHLGYFDDPRDAARAYNKAALEHFGEFAYLNPGV